MVDLSNWGLSRLNFCAPVVPATATASERPDWSPAMRPAAALPLAPQPAGTGGNWDSVESRPTGWWF